MNSKYYCIIESKLYLTKVETQIMYCSNRYFVPEDNHNSKILGFIHK